MSKMIKMPEMTVISREEVLERRIKYAQERAMKETYDESEYPKEYARFHDFVKTLDAEAVKINITDKDNQTETRSFSAEQLPAEAWRLLAAKDKGNRIKIEPESKDYDFAVVSGMTEASLAAMRADGHAAAIITETEQGKFQAVFKFRKGAEGEFAEIQKTLQTRYGNGQQEGIVVPGFYGDTLNRIPRIVSCDPSAPVLGPGRMAERLKEQAPAYAEQARAFAEQQEQMDKAKKKKDDEADMTEKKAEPDQEQQREQAPGLGIWAIIVKVLKFLADIVREGFDHAVKNFKMPHGVGFSIKEEKEPPYWRDKSQWPKAELEQLPPFTKTQKAEMKAQQEAPKGPTKEEVAEVKTQAQAEVQNQEAKAAKRRSRGRSR